MTYLSSQCNYDEQIWKGKNDGVAKNYKYTETGHGRCDGYEGGLALIEEQVICPEGWVK